MPGKTALVTGSSGLIGSEAVAFLDARGWRVHGIDNLWIAGPSVFPTNGYANPGLTIVAMAMRLADHLPGALP